VYGRRLRVGLLDAVVGGGGDRQGPTRAEGIPVDLKGAAEGPYPVGPAELFVPSRFEAQARRILEQIESGSAEVPDEDDASE
jgi:hypothetical protein